MPYGEDPFVWYDPAEDMKAATGAPANDRAPVDRGSGERAAAESAKPAPAVASDSQEDIWVELPEADEKPKRGRRGRGRGRGGRDEAPEAVADAAPVEVAAEAPEPVVEAAPEPIATEAAAEPPAKKPRSRSRKAAEPKAETAPEAAEAAPEPVVQAAPEPEPAPAPREPDPNEISGPPPAPRKGWWRRG